MSSCLSGGGRAAYRLDLEISIKSPCTSWTSNSSSPSSTISESSNNSPIAISTRKPRTPRKRLNQTYNEAAALLSTAYPNIFSAKHLAKPCKFTKQQQQQQQQYSFSYESSDLLLPLQTIDHPCFLIHPPVREKPSYPIRQKQMNLCDKPCQSPGEINSKVEPLEFCDELQEDLDAESILDEEIEEGIDSILGDVNEKKSKDSAEESTNALSSSSCGQILGTSSTTCYGYPVGLGFGVNFDQFGYGIRNNNNSSIIRAFRNADEGEWWRYPSVNVGDITPKFSRPPLEKKKKKVEGKNHSLPTATSRAIKDNTQQKQQEAVAKEESLPNPNAAASLLLKLDYDNILKAWSDRSCPFSDDSPVSEAAGNDVHARLAKIGLFSEGGGIREASVLRYKEKRRARLFSKKIRYQVRKVNADRRPRMKGRFVRRPNSPESEQG